jgi:hypothetical protein
VRPEHEAEELIKGMGRIATVVVHKDGSVIAVTTVSILSPTIKTRPQTSRSGIIRKVGTEQRLPSIPALAGYRGVAWVIHRSTDGDAYLIFSYDAAKSASGIGIVMVSLARFWNETFSCLPDLMAASMSGATGMLA